MTEHIGIYRVERPLGRGGMGEVFLAWDDRLERRVAIKRIRKDAGLSAEQRERFRREARLAARLSHSAVVQIYDLVTGDADDAIVMEYVEGRTLAERLQEGPLEITEALRLAQEIAQGLAAAHEAGLIHRDLKAANIVVTPAGHAKILDFGLARPTVRRSDEEPLTRQGFVIGTFHAMSPEQARGEEVDQRSDLFSLGILLYEMLTGKEPFRGAEPAETLKRIVQEPPPDPRTLRPDLPPEVESLLGRLLAKDRQDRPSGANEVATILERLRIGSGSLLPPGDASVSDMLTSLAPKETVAPVSSKKESLPSSLVGPVDRSRRGLWIATAVALLIVSAAGAAFLVRERPSAGPLRVAVSPIEVVPASDERLALAGSGVLTAAISGLTALEGLAVIDPLEATRGGRLPADMARATAADEILTSRIQRDGNLGRVTLSRLRGIDGRVLWIDTFQVAMDAGLPDAVAIRLREGFPDHDLRPGVPELEVREEDYAAFLEIKQRIEAGGKNLEPDLERLDEIVRSSPRFLEAQLLAARVANSLFLSRREVAFLDRTSELVRKARELAPHDPRPLRQELQATLGADRLPEAQEILDQLEQLLPGDPEILPLRARLAERQGRPDEAAKFLRTAVEQAPSWQNLYRLAMVEARRGRIHEARASIGRILQQDPDNLWAREVLGHLELLYGDLARAETIYADMAGAVPRKSLINLGMARFLRGRFAEAADAYRRALAIDPDYVIALINLADAESELGRAQKADALYRRALELLTARERSVRLDAGDSMRKAQCLARLGFAREAVELAQSELRRNPEDPDLSQQGALVHSLAGERASALNYALAALDKGLQPRWFAGSAFRWLRESPELRSRFPPVPRTY